MTGAEFTRHLTRLEGRFGKQYHADQTKLMWKRLKYFPEAAMDLATEAMICEEKYFPAYNEIRDHLKRVMAAHTRLKMENATEAKVIIDCSQCQDTGIRLRSRRRDMVKDFYCNCKTGQESFPKHDWTISPWKEILNRPNGTSKEEFGRMLKAASRTMKSSIIDVVRDERAELLKKLDHLRSLKAKLAEQEGRNP